MVLEILDNENEIISKIIAQTNLTREQLEEEISKKQEEYGGLLTRAGAAYSIAKELGVDLALKEEEVKITPINELNETISRASVKGIIKRVFPVKEWGKNGKTGKVGSVILDDGSKEIRVTFWNEQCGLMQGINEGDIVEFRNLVVRKRNDAIELSYGKASQIVFKNKNGKGKIRDAKIERALNKEQDATKFNTRYLKISELEDNQKGVNLYARVIKVFPEREFEVKGRKGKVASLVIMDEESNKIRIVLWDKQAELASKLKPGDVIQVKHGYTRRNSGKLELNLGWKGELLVNPDNAPGLPEIKTYEKGNSGETFTKSKRTNIKDLKAGDRYREIKAVVVQAYDPVLLEVCPKCGARISGKCPKCGVDSKFTVILNCELDDGTGVIRGVFYRDVAERFLGMTGDEIKSGGGYDTNKILGIEKIFRGQVKGNERFNRNEFVVREVVDVDLNEELKLLQGE